MSGKTQLQQDAFDVAWQHAVRYPIQNAETVRMFFGAMAWALRRAADSGSPHDPDVARGMLLDMAREIEDMRWMNEAERVLGGQSPRHD